MHRFSDITCQILNTTLMFIRTTTSLLLAIICISLTTFSCKKTDVEKVDSDTEIATKWADLTLQTISRSYFKSPTYSSRSLGYMGLTMYETVVHADSSKRSLSGQLNGLNNLPIPQPNTEYNWLLALNAGQQTMLKYLYPDAINIASVEFAKIDELYNNIRSQKTTGSSQAVIDRSIKFGQDIANAIYTWSKTDGGDSGYKRNFDPFYNFPSGESYWRPPGSGQVVSPFPLHPHWGKNRTFVTANAAIPVPAIVPYSKDPASEYYKLYKAVYLKNIMLTQEEKEIAAWWADDPTETFSPPGHSYNLATIAIRKSEAKYVKAAETYARVGMATADAFINCWKTKVVYFNERPSTFVRANINPTWIPYWPEPPFPAFPSGHSTQSAAAAIVLTGIYGDNFSFTDYSHVGASRFSADLKFRERHFPGFWASAEESAYSRFLGGIHTEQDNIVGLDQGKKIGTNINQLLWNK
jgi:hypothetical protein